MDAPLELPEPEELQQALRWLDSVHFPVTAALPLFTARHWSPGMERRARWRYRRGLDNVEEVAVPRWYWRGLPAVLAPLFRALTLGQGGLDSDPLACLLDARGWPRWRLVPRFSRYLLHSRPEADGPSLVYFGDDTLFLMERARRLLAEQPRPCRVLDLCCGGGGVGLALPPFEGELIGVDVNPTAISLARLAAQAQGLTHHSYLCADATTLLREQKFDLVVGNPPTLPPELGGQTTLYATGSSANLLTLLVCLLEALTPAGRALLTVFSTASGRGEKAGDPLRRELSSLLGPCRGYTYTVRRQFPLAGGRFLRHVALSVEAESATRGERFEDLTAGGFALPGFTWRRSF
jgi:SAM-dependent methyltransferase